MMTKRSRWVQQNLGYFISYNNLFSTWISIGRDFDVSNVTDALSAFNRNISSSHKKVFEKIFQTLETGLSKLGDSSGARTKAISGLLQLIKDIPMDGKQDYDVLGFIYEYLIEKFAANAGKKAGEFYTPHEVSLLMSEIVANHLKGKNEIEIYDSTSGSGSLLINIGKSVSKYMPNSDNIKYYAQELKENTYNLTRMNLVMRGINTVQHHDKNALIRLKKIGRFLMKTTRLIHTRHCMWMRWYQIRRIRRPGIRPDKESDARYSRYRSCTER